MKKVIAFLCVFVFGLFGYAYLRFQKLDDPIQLADDAVEFRILPGSSFRVITQKLSELGIVNDPLFFEMLGRYEGVERKIKAGDYIIKGRPTARTILQSILEGTLPKQIRVTIPEGFNRWQIADRLSQHGLAHRTEFLEMVEHLHLEGQLYPETYLFTTDSNVRTIVERLRSLFEKHWADIVKNAETGVLSDDQKERLIIIASLVQKESKHPLEQKKIARVILNRLAKNMKLQIDPTCVYGELTYRKKPHPRYCKDPKNRYSTYLHHGLTPGPISNPGRTALEAVLNPYQGPDAEKILFFVALGDGSGRHRFSTNYRDHRQAVRAYVQRLRTKPKSRTVGGIND